MRGRPEDRRTLAKRLEKKLCVVGHYDVDDEKLVVIVTNIGRRKIRGVVIDARLRSLSSGQTLQRQRIEVEPLPPGYSIRRLRPDAVFTDVAVEARIARVIV